MGLWKMLKKNCVVACCPIVACSYLRSHLDGTHTLTGQQLTGNVNSLVETTNSWFKVVKVKYRWLSGMAEWMDWLKERWWKLGTGCKHIWWLHRNPLAICSFFFKSQVPTGPTTTGKLQSRVAGLTWVCLPDQWAASALPQETQSVTNTIHVDHILWGDHHIGDSVAKLWLSYWDGKDLRIGMS